jgi:hypothetical protein
LEKVQTTVAEQAQQAATHWGNVAENIGEAFQAMAPLMERVSKMAEDVSAMVRDYAKFLFMSKGEKALAPSLKRLEDAVRPDIEAEKAWLKELGLIPRLSEEQVKDIRSAYGESRQFEQWQDQVRGTDLIPVRQEPIPTDPGMFEEMWQGASAAVLNYQENVANAMQATHDAVTEGLFATQQVISDVFFDALTGKMKSFKEYMLTFLKDLSSALSDFAAKMAMMGIIKGAVGAATSLFGGGGGLIPVGGGGWGGPAATGGGGLIPVSGGSASFGSLLNPSVTGMGGLTSVGAGWQLGGIAPARPTPAVLGEGGIPEAIVPLPHGRAIPVEFTDGSPAGAAQHIEVHNHISVSTVDGISTMRAIKDIMPWMIQQIQQGIHQDPHSRAFYRKLR